jgi:hypothetical protein
MMWSVCGGPLAKCHVSSALCCVSHAGCVLCVQVAAAGSHDLLLKWIDALIDFEGSLRRHVFCAYCHVT